MELKKKMGSVQMQCNITMCSSNVGGDCRTGMCESENVKEMIVIRRDGAAAEMSLSCLFPGGKNNTVVTQSAAPFT